MGGSLIGLADALAKLMTASTFCTRIDLWDGFPLSFRVDPLAAFFLVAVYAVCALAALYSFHYLDKPEKSLGTAINTFFFSLLIVSMAMVVAADNMLTFMLAWEGMSLSSFFLVIHDYASADNRKAGFLYLVFSQVGAMFILAGFGLIYSHTGSLELLAASLSTPLKTVVFVLCFIGFGSKAGIFPFHVWLPHAHPAAPSHISAVMSGVMIKTGIYGIIRIYSLLELHTPVLGQIVLLTGIVSGILGVVYALGQHDLKRLLAYHSVENIGIILIGLGIGMLGVAAGQPAMAVLGFAGGLLHVLNHAIFKSLLFMGAGIVIQKTGTRTIDALGGLMKSMPTTGITFLIGSLAISGLPPLNGFVSEFLVYLAGFRGLVSAPANLALSAAAIVGLAIIGGLALACFSKVVGVVFQGEARTPIANVDERGATMRLPLVVLATACVAIGIFPQSFVFMAIKGVEAIATGYGPIDMAPFLKITMGISLAAFLFLVLLLLVAALRQRAYKGKTITRAGTWGCGFTQPTVRMQYSGASYAASILDFFKPVAPHREDHPAIQGRFPPGTHYHSHIEDIAEMNLTRGIVHPVLWLFDRLRWIQHGDIHLYIGYILLAIVILLFFI